MRSVSGHCLGKQLVMFVGYLEWEARKKERRNGNTKDRRQGICGRER